MLGEAGRYGILLQQKQSDMNKTVFAFALVLLFGTGFSTVTAKNKQSVVDKAVSVTPGSVTFKVEDVEVAANCLSTVSGSALGRKWAEGGGYLSASFVGETLVDGGNNAFFSMVCLAYAQHRPIVISPDALWIVICNGFSQFVNRDPEKYRDLLVSHQGKETLVIKTTPQTTTAEKVEKFAALIGKETKGDLAELMTCNFSTTGTLERMVSRIVLMDAVKQYFDYMEMLIGCGIPSVTLEGTPEDWKLLRTKTQELGKYGVKSWTDRLDGILEEFVKASEGNPNPKFWFEMAVKGRPKDFHLKGDGGCLPLYGPTPFDGWFLEFIPFDTWGERPWKIPYGHELPPLMTSVPIIQYVEDLNGECIGVNGLELRAGIVGLSQDNETKALRPEIGWLVRMDPSLDFDEADVRDKAQQVKAMGDGDAVLKQAVKRTRKESNAAAKESSKIVAYGVKPVAGDVVFGVVQDADGPMMMVNVTERDAENRIVAHSVTDIEGKFSFRLVDPDDTISVSYVGYYSAESSIDGSSIEVTLVEQTDLLPVVILKDNLNNETDGNGFPIPLREVTNTFSTEIQ